MLELSPLGCSGDLPSVPALGTGADSHLYKKVTMSFVLVPLALLAAVAGVVALFIRQRNIETWLASYLKQDWRAPVAAGVTKHVMFCFVDHYEPMWKQPDYATECKRVARWRQEYPALCAPFKDADGRGPVHSFFYPEEEYRPEHLDPLVEICRMGLGEIEIHLHHDKDTEAGLREKLRRFTQLLVDRHDALPVDPVTKQPRWGFIHGNWALDNSHPDGYGCGVNNELIVLREEGCYVDYTFPASPDPCQTSTINKIYYAKDDPHACKSHDTGVRVVQRVQPASVADSVRPSSSLSLASARSATEPPLFESEKRRQS